jgi:ribosomal protein S18 acetylase RimI-like enzyme
LDDFLYHAIFIPEGVEYPPYDIIYDPEIYIYVKDFGLDTDCGVVAEDSENKGKIVGAAWTRIIPAYGHLDENTPELAISTLPDCRGQGVGTMLMNRLFELLRERGYKRTSLSVQKNNPAVRFYERLGYEITDEKLDHVGHEDYIMVKEL